MNQYFYKHLKLQNSTILISSTIGINILCVFIDYVIKITLGFYSDFSEHIFYIIYTSIFTLTLINLTKKLQSVTDK